MKIKYRLREKEVMETLESLDYKRLGKRRSINMGVLSVLGAVELVFYLKNPGHVMWMILLFFTVLLLFYLTYGLKYNYRRKAKKICAADGEYLVEFTEKGILSGNTQEFIKWDPKNSWVYVSEWVVTVKIGRQIFSIPKRVLGEEKEKELIRLIGNHGGKVVRLIKRKE